VNVRSARRPLRIDHGAEFIQTGPVEAHCHQRYFDDAVLVAESRRLQVEDRERPLGR